MIALTALNVKPSIDFKVDTTTGIAYISQRKAAELLGVPRSTLQYALKNPMIYTDTLRARFETFLNRAKNDGLTGNQLSYKSTTYLDEYSFKVVDTYAMDMQTAMAFAMWINPGIAYISQRKAAELLGVPRSTLQYALKNPMIYTDTLAGVNGNENNQLDENSLAKLAYHFAQKGNEKALRAMYAFTLAGARAYIYPQRIHYCN